ncbi:TonB-dependent siderophore receptor [Microbulbifer sp. MLAF003]|uniref:TonB-dependent siderophore receptor n=1 Tax=Microbulbifer sp. MLAF003 TaxID=3032582 RepID=UPI0024AE4B21|nr:TonB-dependent siderophore receptor [Microbulbifer sp. MLAF003]WHI49853.1 TonB-dependent siderophore receptor [Microbulbifer sp. MLAF003]
MGTARIQGLRQNSSPILSGLSHSLLALAIAAGGSTAAFAAEDKNEGIEEVHVTGELNLSRQTSIGKQDIPVDETPFSISLRDKDFFDVTGSKTVQDILQYSAGVNGGLFGVDARGDWSTVRAVEPIMFVDGLKTTFGSYTGSRANLYAFERVEILKGPSSVLYGQGSTGGIVNLVSKRPKEEFGGELMVQGGDYDRKVIAGDVTGAFDSDGEWLYRVVGYARDADAQVDHVDDDSTLLMPSVSWRPSADTEITFLVNHQEEKTGTTAAFLPWGGTIVDNVNGQIPTDTFISEPGWDKYNTEQTAYSLWVDHRLNDSWGINAGLRYSKGDVDYNSMYADYTLALRLQKDLREVSRTVYMKDAKSDLLIFDLRLSGELTTGSLEHQISAGVDSQNAEIDNSILRARGYGGDIDIFDPVYGYVPEGLEGLDREITDVNAEQVGIYFQDQVSLGNFIFNLGLREDRLSSRTHSNVSTKASDKQRETELTKRFGVMYAFDSGVSPYVSYSESFEAVLADPNSQGGTYEPVKGEQIEAGIKYQPEGTNILMTASAFEIKQKNRLTFGPDRSYRQIGEAQIDGFELEASGQWGNLTLVANYSQMDTEIVESSDPFEVGTEIETVPEEQFSLWGNYDFSEWVPGLSVGVGARHVGDSYTGIDKVHAQLVTAYAEQAAYYDYVFADFPTENPSYTLYDATIGYTLESWKFQLNVKNLTDEIHTTSCLSRGDCFYGERRYVTAEARYTF